MDGIAGSGSESNEVLIDGGDVSDDPQAAVVPRRMRAEVPGRRRAIFLLVVCNAALFPNWCPPDFRGEPVEAIGSVFLSGAVLAEWTLTSDAENDEMIYMDSIARKMVSAREVYGNVFYLAVETLELLHRLEVDDPRNLNPMQLIAQAGDALADRSLGGQCSFGNCITEWLRDVRHRIFSIRVCPRLCAATLQKRWQVFHAVAVTRKINRDRLFGGPSPAELSKFRSEVDALARVQHCGVVQRRAHFITAIPVAIILDWLWASRHLKDAANINDAKRDWVRVFSSSADTRAAMLEDSSVMNRETLRRARVRLDCVAMLLTRAFFANIPADHTNLYIFCDGSPQHRGLELFASTLDVHLPGHHRRILLPMLDVCPSALGPDDSDWGGGG
eukprot:9503901-Pyramimonas_sp.AAC.1